MNNRVALAASMVMLTASVSCAPLLAPGDYDEVKMRLDAAQLEIEAQRQNMTELQADYNTLNDRYGQLLTDYNDLEGGYEALWERIELSDLKDPSWAELKEFLEEDDTDEKAYEADKFDCTGFAITLRDRAWRYGFRCAYVEVGFPGMEGHAVNAFQTSDKGLAYVDVTEADQISYIQKGRPFGSIMLEGVKETFISCDGDPEDFYRSLKYASISDITSYAYYEDYQTRVQFYHDSVDAYNEAVDDFNRGRGERSFSQMKRWQENLDELWQDLGLPPPYYDADKAVESVEAYWN